MTTHHRWLPDNVLLTWEFEQKQDGRLVSGTLSLTVIGELGSYSRAKADGKKHPLTLADYLPIKTKDIK